MKRSILAICFLAAFAVSGFAATPVSPYLKVGAKGTVIKNKENANAEETQERETIVMPMIGIGIERTEGPFGVQVSADYSWKKEGEETFSAYTAPKVLFLGYLFPKKAASLYAGLGTSWSGVEIENSTFHGIFGNASLGAEFNPSDSVRGVVELNCDVPAVAAVSEGERPYPLVSIRIGLGF